MEPDLDRNMINQSAHAHKRDKIPIDDKNTISDVSELRKSAEEYALSTYTWNACCITTGFLHENKCPSFETYLEVFEWCASMKDSYRTQALLTGSLYGEDETMEGCNMKVEN